MRAIFAKLIFLGLIFSSLSISLIAKTENPYNRKYDYPHQGPLQWRYVEGLGYRKFTPLQAFRKDLNDLRPFYWGGGAALQDYFGAYGYYNYNNFGSYGYYANLYDNYSYLNSSYAYPHR